MPIALILVDALSPTYVSRSTLPSIVDLARDGFTGPLANLYAYRGIEATLFTGRFPSEHGVWGEFRPSLGAERASDRLMRLMIRAGDLLPADRLRFDARYIAHRLNRSHQPLPTVNLIPPRLLSRFSRSVETPIGQPGSLGLHRTLFDELRAARRPFELVGYPVVGRDEQIVPHVRMRLHQADRPDFWYIKFSALDTLGHRYGPDTLRLGPALAKLDRQLAELFAMLQSAYPGGEIDLIVVSDHGMSRVSRTFDIRPLLKRANLELGRDYLYFLDSTTIRMWSESQRVLEAFARCLADQPDLRILDADARAGLHLPDDDSSGDLLVALDEGNVVFPDFFRRQTPPAGMHGYAFVQSPSGLPFLAVGPALAALLPSDRRLSHVDVWALMRRRLNLAERRDAQLANESVCTFSS